MEEITQEDIQKIADAVAKKMAEALLAGPAQLRAENCFHCGFKGTFKCEQTPVFECTTQYRCGNGFIRVVGAVQTEQG